MSFNQFVWSIYKESEQGQRAIARFTGLTPDSVEERFEIGNFIWELTEEGEHFWGKKELVFSITGLVEKYATQNTPQNENDVLHLFESLTSSELALQAGTAAGEYAEFGRFGAAPHFQDWIEAIQETSFGLYLAHSVFFLPYLYQRRFHELQATCDAFNIPLPPLPGKRDWTGRIRYYTEINQVLQEFRLIHELSPPEMCAFLYDFAPEYLRQTDTELPSPSKVWLITGGSGNNGDFEWLDQANPTSVSNWQGNIDTRRGDILLMYCVSPRSYIHSIWRATCDGFTDPFFFYHNTIWVGSPTKTTPVTFKEMKAHPLLSQKGAIKAHFQGPSGKPFTVEEYQAVLEIMAEKGQNISELPSIERTSFLPDTELTCERDVETKLIEPFLKKIGWQDSDWIRQMTIRMGRGERNYPDYAFNARTTRGEESASMIVESKFRILTRRELNEAYCQSKSYALRLQANIMIIAALEGIWVFGNQNGFSFDEVSHWSWKQLEHPDTLHEVWKLAGK